MNALLLKGGHVLDPAHPVDGVADLLLRDGKVLPKGGGHAERLDVSGCWVMPGFIDLRCHLRSKGDLAAALQGGFTTVVCTPDSATLVSDEVRVIRPGYLTHPEGNALGDSPKAFQVLSNGFRPVSDAALMRRALQYCAEAQTLAMSHAEEVSLSGQGALGDGPTAARLGLAAVPPSAETVAVARDILLLEETGGRLHFAHLTSARSLALVAEAKARGLRVTADVALCHLTSCDELAVGYNRAARVKPVLRTRADRDSLIEALRSGTLDAVASDHVARGGLDEEEPFEASTPGHAAHPGLWRALLGAGLSPQVAAAALTSGPAKVLGLERGHLGEGAPADLTIVDRETAEVRYVIVAGKVQLGARKESA
jgi:dihydroorotase